MLAGGIGITPFRSIIKNATERKLAHRIVLLYSNRNRASTAFLDELTDWAKQNPNLTVVPAYTDETGFIDGAFIIRHMPDAATAIAYAAGPAAFVTAMRTAALQAGVDPDQIRAEEFPGY
jgi:ferredoxin-NADP reductase